MVKQLVDDRTRHLIDALAIAEEAGILVPRQGGFASPVPVKKIAAKLKIDGQGGPARLLVRAVGDTAPTVIIGEPGVTATVVRLGTSDTWITETEELAGGRILVTATHDVGVLGMWLVRRASEIPPPPPRAWDAGPEPADP